MDGADTAVVRRVDIAHLKARALRGKTPAAKCTKCAQVFDLIECVVLLHELRELVGGEKFSDGGLERAWIDERNGERRFRIHHRHPVLNVALHTREPYSHTALEELAREAHATESEVVNVIRQGPR